jgi:catechol 2,3-dioxygenase-like lactoylglutathione lyase family enzyme
MDATAGIVPAQLTLGVGDIAETEKFYRDKLGMRVERQGDSLRIGFGDFIVLFEHAPPPERAKLELALRAVDAATLDAIAARIGAPTYDRDGGGRALYVTDPDHYTVEIFVR